jgi:hypothetical protein
MHDNGNDHPGHMAAIERALCCCAHACEEKMKLPDIKQEPEPKGKRRIHWNIWGNWVGYIGRYRWMTFSNEADAIEWRDNVSA